MPLVDSADGPRFALRGRIVTMDGEDAVLPDGVLYINRGTIDHVLPAGSPPPEGYADVTPVDTAGTAYPGLIELHNHLPYDVLQLWQVPRLFANRTQWGGGSNAAYRRLVTGPMGVLGDDPESMPAVARYVEAKALIHGTTTSQGVALFSNTGSRRMYRGLVRNVEATDDPELPEAKTRIADVEASDARRFLARLQQPHRLLLHLAEGTNDRARAHFQALEFEPGKWAITENLVGIHCTPLTAEDFQIMVEHGGSMVWSPLSNLLLYGRTADIAAAKAAGVLVGLGSDWSVSGSKGLLGELKAAQLASAAGGAVFTDRELVAMATRDAARILRWDRSLGALSPGFHADVVVIGGQDGDAYTSLVGARDADVSLVVVNGFARYGTTTLMAELTPDPDLLEGLDEHELPDRSLNLHHPSADPVVGDLTLAEATRRLTEALANLSVPAPPVDTAPRTARGAEGAPVWRLALDEIVPTGSELRPRLPLPGRRDRVPSGPVISGVAPPPEPLQPLALDALVASTDTDFLDTLEAESNLPESFGARLRDLLA
ncbi:amidohydrolase family protein [Streptomyces venezuelae]|uniref:amidohydrolase family protein n=1 Tax=Streptomyces venezuelae TaxID=54571 RepID=UPI00123C0018|nr:amidohydrolase family protein [Streptomyces venezuelae]QES09979.1 amidohydrolase [Streptomyces venezuelae]